MTYGKTWLALRRDAAPERRVPPAVRRPV